MNTESKEAKDPVADLPWDAIRARAPEDFSARVMGRIPQSPPAHPFVLWMRRATARPVLAWAAALALAAAGWALWIHPGASSAPSVVFQIHAPDAETMEVLGSFNDWKPGTMVMEGPDAAGYWHTHVNLPPGRHEYVFLMNGQKWVPDPGATFQRPDGFGNVNSVLEM